MPSAYSSCTNVTPECPVSATTYGYRPNLAANTLFLAIFAICTILQLVLGIRYRLRAFLAVTTIGCALEAAGYVGRILMHINPWDNSGFELQIICIILAPSFLAAGIYLTLKHLVIQFGPEQSRLPPRLYTWIFCGCDAVSIVVQAGGGGLAATHNPKLLNIGNDLIIAGISFQVLTMLICWILAVDFAIRVARSKSSPLHGQSRGFLFYLVATIIAFFTIFVRCVYRIPEMSKGWGSPLQRHETEFLILDGAMVAIASILMTAAHPGIFFPAISSRYQKLHLSGSQASQEEMSQELKH